MLAFWHIYDTILGMESFDRFDYYDVNFERLDAIRTKAEQLVFVPGHRIAVHSANRNHIEFSESIPYSEASALYQQQLEVEPSAEDLSAVIAYEEDLYFFYAREAILSLDKTAYLYYSRYEDSAKYSGVLEYEDAYFFRKTVHPNLILNLTYLHGLEGLEEASRVEMISIDGPISKKLLLDFCRDDIMQVAMHIKSSEEDKFLNVMRSIGPHIKEVSRMLFNANDLNDAEINYRLGLLREELLGEGSAHIEVNALIDSLAHKIASQRIESALKQTSNLDLPNTEDLEYFNSLLLQ